jgi:septal ring factor EnvC (AmiA/AmiB activator)
MLGRVILFLKHHWKIPAVVVLLLVCAFFYRSKIAALLGSMQQTREDYKKALEESHKANKDAIEEVSRSALATLEKEEERQKSIRKDIRALENERDNLEEELQEDIDELARKIKERF